MEPVAIFDADGGHEFLGIPVRPVSEHTQVAYDLIIVATLVSSGPQVAALIRDGVPPGKLFPLRREIPEEPAPAAATPRGARK